jgi:hypothetical protein
MSDEFDRSAASQERSRAVQREQTEFQEVPGEADANAVRDAFLQRAGSHPATMASALSRADPTGRAHAAVRLQQEMGNAYMQRVAAESRGSPGRLVGRPQPDMVEEVQRRKGAGSSLPEGTRQQMEGFFGADMSGVRVHADDEASVLSWELNASAFTVGSDVFLAEGKYNPGTTEGQALLAHELTHVGQQTGFGAGSAQRQEAPEEEEILQRQGAPEEEEVLQRQEVPEEEEVQR